MRNTRASHLLAKPHRPRHIAGESDATTEPRPEDKRPDHGRRRRLASHGKPQNPARSDDLQAPKTTSSPAAHATPRRRNWSHLIPTQRPRLHHRGAPGRPTPTMYTPDAWIRGSPTLPLPERPLEGKGTRWFAGERGKLTGCLRGLLSTVARDKGIRKKKARDKGGEIYLNP